MIIYNRTLKQEVLKLLIARVQSGKYKGIPVDLIKKQIIKELTNYPALIDTIEKKKTQERIVKILKQHFYKGIGAFQGSTIPTHSSTKDRDYTIYKKIFTITGIPKKIVDLGAGINPLAYKRLGCKPAYLALEINKQYVDIDNKYFKDNNIQGKAFYTDILTAKLAKADIYFLFKLLESVELVKSHKTSETLLRKIPAKYIIVSFSTKTLSGKQMNVPTRRWFLLMIERLAFRYTVMETENEVFYILYH